MNQKIKFSFSLILLIFSFIFIPKNSISQIANNGIFFQAIARDNFSNPAKNRKIYVESNIIQTSATGTKVLTEEHQTNTDATGVFSISIGKGTRIAGTANNLASIDWANGPYFLNLKIAITPIVPATTWDYKKEWIDLGTTLFGAVPYALYAGTAAGLNDKLNINDTSSMLAIYAKINAIKILENIVGSKISSTDTAAMLAPYKKIVNEIIASNITSLTADAIYAALNTKLNLIDSNRIYVTPAQLAAKTFDISPINNNIATKLNISDSVIKYVTPKQLTESLFNPTEIIKSISSKADTSEITKLSNQKANLNDVNINLSNKINIADSNIKYVTPTQLAAKTFDITPINNSLAAKLNSSDTSSMLSARFARDTVSINNRINQKANNTDVNNSLALKANSADVSTALDLKVDKVLGKDLSTNDYTNTEKAKLSAISGNNSGDQDLSSYATNSSLNLKVNITDTTTMLSDRFKRDTASLSNRINLKLNIADTTDMLNNRINRDTNSLSNRINSKVDKEIGKVLSSNDYTNTEKTKLATITGNNTGDQDLSSYATNLNLNLKVNITDTTTMLSDRFKRDTASLSNRINLKANSADVASDLALKQAIIAPGTTGQFYRGDKTWQTISYTTIGAAPTIGSSSITTLGTIGSGIWNGTTIAVANGGTGATTLTANGVLVGNGTSPISTVAPSTNGNVLTSNGTNWISSTPSITLIREVANEFSATTSQTSFTLTQTPSINSKVKMFINGVRISNSAYSVSGTTLTYNPTNNGAYFLTLGDRIQFEYYY